MTLPNAICCKIELIFYESGLFVDLRCVDLKTANLLKLAVENELKSGEFENMSRIVEVGIKRRFGCVLIDAQKDDDMYRFLEFWTFPYSRRLPEGWTVVLNIKTKTVYDDDGKKVDGESW
jgi:hypothetical protein